jgi:protein involved in polysaccharide export with SLBB domain
MKIALFAKRMGSLGGVLATLLCVTQLGCITGATRAIPAGRLPDIYKAAPKCEEIPVNLTLLRQEPPREYLLGEGDMLGIFVPSVLPVTVPGTAQIMPLIPQAGLVQRDVYPPLGNANVPTLGVPIQIGTGGMLALPRISPLNITGKTLTESADIIRQAYLDTGILAEGQPVSVTLVKARVQRVLVLREDIESNAPVLIPKTSMPYTRKGEGDIVDLPAYENDVLHLLAATGGLPGIETYSHVWILKSASPEASAEAQGRVGAGEDAGQVFRALNAQRTAIRIPLKIKPGEQLPFGPQDVILHTGDVVYLEPRETEVFYTGGLLPGAEIPLPRDRDIDVMEAVAIANGSLGGLGGASAAVFRAGAGPGNVIPPSRVVVVRKLPNGQEIMIRVDLSRARFDPTERVIIQPGDFVMMHYKPGEIASNVALNFFQFTFLISGN